MIESPLHELNGTARTMYTTKASQNLAGASRKARFIPPDVTTPNSAGGPKR